MRVVKLFNEKKVPLTIAMVPCDSSECAISPTSKDSLYIKELNSTNIEIALHGLTHQDINNHGEFGGLDSLESLRRIEKGKFTLQTYLQKEITTFIPPFNAYNRHTEYAMLQNGLSILSGDMYSNAHNNEIQYFPETLGHLMARNGIWSAAESVIMNCQEQDAVCVVMFHAYDLPDEQSWQQLESLLDACKANKDVQCYTYQSLLASGVESSATRYRANQLHSGLQKYCMHEGVLHTTWLCWLVHVLNALLYAVLPLLLLVGWCRQRKWLSLVFALFGSVLFAGLALSQMVGPIKLFALDGLYVIVASVGLWIVNRVKGKKSCSPD
jgi:predicted deacetylase